MLYDENCKTWDLINELGDFDGGTLSDKLIEFIDLKRCYSGNEKGAELVSEVFILADQMLSGET